MKKEEAPEFKDFWQLLKNNEIKNVKQLDLATSRFENIYNRESVEDKIIDYAISLEILFSMDGDTIDSLAHKYSFRCARLLKANPDERRKVHFYNGRRRWFMEAAKKTRKLFLRLIFRKSKTISENHNYNIE